MKYTNKQNFVCLNIFNLVLLFAILKLTGESGVFQRRLNCKSGVDGIWVLAGTHPSAAQGSTQETSRSQLITLKPDLRRAARLQTA